MTQNIIKSPIINYSNSVTQLSSLAANKFNMRGNPSQKKILLESHSREVRGEETFLHDREILVKITDNTKIVPLEKKS